MAKYTFLCRNCLTEIVASREDIRTKGTCPRCGCSYTVPTAEDEYVYTELLRQHGINPLSVSQDPPEYVRQLIESYGIPVPALDNLESTVKPVALPGPMDPGRTAMILNFIGALFIIGGFIEIIVGTVLALETEDLWVFLLWLAASLMTFWFGLAAFVLSSMARNLFGIRLKMNAHDTTPSPAARPSDDSKP